MGLWILEGFGIVGAPDTVSFAWVATIHTAHIGIETCNLAVSNAMKIIVEGHGYQSSICDMYQHPIVEFSVVL